MKTDTLYLRLGINKMFIYRTIDQYNKISFIKDRPRPGCLHTSRMPELIKQACEKAMLNPRKSVRKLEAGT